ncbi:LamG domain-containing protein [Spirillospora sp. NPDC050679]
MADPALLLHWPLDAPTVQGTAADDSGNGFTGTFSGGPVGVLDATLGGCTQFDGTDDYALLHGSDPKLALGGYTVSVWLKLRPGTRTGNVGVIWRQDSPESFALEVTPDGHVTQSFVRTRETGWGRLTLSSPDATVADGAWHHVAFTNDHGELSCFVDGVQVIVDEYGGQAQGGTADFWVGRGGATDSFFPGQLAHLRLYDGAQDVLGVRADMAADGVAAQDLQARPLDFTFTNDDQQAVLYIDEGTAGQTMTLRVTNTSKYTIEFTPLTSLSDTSHHLALNFRTGTLAAGLQPDAADPASWGLVLSPDGTALYLRWLTPVPLAPGATLEIPVSGLNADGADGTRGTRVELTYRRLHYSGETDELAGARLRFLDVVNNRGRRDLPIDFRLVGGDEVYADGASDSALTLHLTNTLRDGPGVALRSAAPASAFTVSFDVQEANEDRPWALTTADAAAHAVLTAADPARWHVAADPLGQRMLWTVTPVADTVLKPDEVIELDLTGVRALPSPGQAPILAEYRNIPGYVDGVLTTQARRTTMITTAAGRVGIGTPAPDSQLHIGAGYQEPTDGTLILGYLNSTSLRFGRKADHAWIQSHGPAPLVLNPFGGYAVGIGAVPQARLHLAVTAQQVGDAASLQIGPGPSTGLRLGRTNTIAFVQADTSLSLNANGQLVSIGPVSAPKGRLHVQGPLAEPGGLPLLFLGSSTSANLQAGIGFSYAWMQAGGTPLALNPQGGAVRVGPYVPADRVGALTVSASDTHLQLRREASAGGNGSTMFLELFQDTTTDGAVTRPFIRFHHGNKFWFRMEAGPEGFWFHDGPAGSSNLADVYAGVGRFARLEVEGQLIGGTELTWLYNQVHGVR